VAAVAAPGRPLRVALLTSARAWRGSGVSLTHIARGLGARGHTVQLLATTPAVTAGFAAAGLPVQELPIHDTSFAEARRLTRALAALRADVLIAETARDVRLGALASACPPVRAGAFLQRQRRRTAARSDHAPCVPARPPHNLPNAHGRARCPGERSLRGTPPASRDP